MLFQGTRPGLASVVVIVTCASLGSASAERIDSGDQTIDGTRVHTTIYHERGYAVFTNDCGTQQLTQSQLQGGAKPTNIIPCPRPSSPAAAENQYRPSTGQRLWAAIAAGVDDGLLRSKVGAGFGQDHATRAEAEAAALSACRERVSSCQVVTAWNSGCYYITVSEGSSNVAWGAGPTAQDAYNECYRRISGGNCQTNTLGGCYPD